MKLARLGSRDFLKAVRPFVGLFVVLVLFAMDTELRSLFFKGGNFRRILPLQYEWAKAGRGRPM